MKIAHLAIQCRAHNGHVGSFLFEPDARPHEKPPVSPVFPSLAKLFSWCRENHWTNASYAEVLRNRGACGTYVNRTI